MLNYSKYIIDAHAHIFPDKIAVKAADNIGRFYDLYMNFDGTTDTLIKQGDECGVSKFVVQSVATVPHQVKRINDFIVSAVQKYPDRLIGFGSLHPDMNGMEEEIDRLISIGLHGIKLHPDFQKFAINDENACRIYDAVGDRLPFLIHTGDKRYKYSNPSLMAEIAKKYPHTRFIAAHFGGWSEWEKAEQELVGLDNIWVDTSSSFYSMTPEKAAELITKFGSDRVFFGTDYPMWRADKDLEFLDKIPLGEDIKETAFSDWGFADEDISSYIHIPDQEKSCNQIGLSRLFAPMRNASARKSFFVYRKTVFGKRHIKNFKRQAVSQRQFAVFQHFSL